MVAALECVAVAYYKDQTSAVLSVAQMAKNVTSLLAVRTSAATAAALHSVEFFTFVLHKRLKFPLSGARPNPKTCHVVPC